MHSISSPRARKLINPLFWAQLALAAGCQVAPPPKPVAVPAELAPLPPLQVVDAAHYSINARETEVRVLVFRGGPLAKYGHNHVLRAGNVKGDVYLAPRFADSGFSLSFAPGEFIIDPQDARAEEGAEFATRPSPQAIDGTRKNMLGPEVLDSEHFPEITIRSVALTGPEWGPEATVRVALHGVARDLTVPIAIERCDAQLITTGALVLHITDFGMTPFSVMGGGLQVQDEVKVRFRIVAEKA